MGWPIGILSVGRRLLGRAVHHAGGATRTDVRGLQSGLEQVRAELARCTVAVAHMDETRTRLEQLAGHVEAVDAQLATLVAKVDGLHRLHAEAQDTFHSAENALAIDAFSRFIRSMRLDSESLVSVILPTYNRPRTLGRAIESVLAQRYRNWELLVVDDGGDTDSRSIVDSFGDRRIRWMRVDHRGVCAARNAALAVACGEIVAYVDDDNVMDPDWLYSVAWALDQRPEYDVLYGAFVVDDLLRVGGQSSGHLPRTFLHAFNRQALRHNNLADMGAIAHRSGLPEARFDEGLVQMGDWDLLVRLTADRDPLVLPAIACYYMTDAPNRLTLGSTRDDDGATVRARAAVLGP